MVHLLLLVTIAELAFNRLATRELRPPGDVPPPWWHQVLDHFGLFCQYFASTLAVGIIVHHLWRLARRGGLYTRVARFGLVAAGVPFLALIVLSLVRSPGAHMSFWLETFFVAVVLSLVAAQVARGGDRGVKIGLLFLATPLVVHYFGPLWLHVFAGEEARWSDLPERVQLYGQWTAVAAALASAYCFAPRPFVYTAARVGPLVVATFVGVLGTVILRQHYEVGMRLASQGLGMDIGPGAPSRFLALYLVALATVTWTMASCLTADSTSRRDIGVGLGLVVVGGYAFAWPLQYLVSVVGLMTISAAATRVAGEERASVSGPSFLVPPIDEPVLRRYLDELIEKLREKLAPPATASIDRPAADLVEVVTSLHGVPVRLEIGLESGSIVAIEVVCGAAPPPERQPDWTLYARSERLLGVGSHPEPPATAAAARKIGDHPFDERFRIRDAGDFTAALLDDGLRARAIALIDGWVAYWDGVGLRYCVLPGNGAPLDHPIPITELAFRGAGAASSADRLLAVMDLLACMTSRAMPPGEPAGEEGAEAAKEPLAEAAKEPPSDA